MSPARPTPEPPKPMMASPQRVGMGIGMGVGMGMNMGMMNNSINNNNNHMHNKRTMAMGGFGLGQVLKTFMTEHAAIPEDLEIVDDTLNHSSSASAIMGRTRSNSTVSVASGRSRSSSVSVTDESVANLADVADVE